MKTFDKIKIKLDDGAMDDAVAPEIISASRRTDIPAFYSDWFFDRLKKGYADWVNPYSQKVQHVSFENAKFIVFWTKNAYPLTDKLESLDNLGVDWYLHFTINDYPKDIEPNVPPLMKRIETLRNISNKYGKDKVIWRFDPLFVIDGVIEVDGLVDRVCGIFDRISGLTDKLVISFADINRYRKVMVNLCGTGVRELSSYEQFEFSEKLMERIGAKGEFEVSTCSESVDLSAYGISRNSCIDGNLISEITRYDAFSRDVLKYGKDCGQRDCCLCTVAKDIGSYNTCAHGCKYCYANITPEYARENFEKIIGTKDTSKLL